MTDGNPSPQPPQRSTGQTILLVLVWIFGSIFALFGLVYLGCGGSCL